MRDRQATICCRQCKGTGQQEMPPAFVQTLRVLTRNWQTTPQLAERLGRIKQPALCNRLVEMLQEGLVERRAVEHKAHAYEWRLA